MSPATEVPIAAPPPECAAQIVWTHRAERQLRYELIRTHGSADALPDRLARLNEWLALAFPHASAVVVLDVYLGFRPRTGEYILFVDARGATDCGTAIVKLADDEARLRSELAAWENCTPPCFHGNAVFMGLSARTGGRPPRLVALVYQDAQPHIGTDETAWLEAAVLRCVRFGVPDTHTLIDSLRELFAHLGRVLYPAARVEPLEPGGIELNPHAVEGTAVRRQLCDTFPLWDGAAQQVSPVGVRKQVSAAFGSEHARYIDPVDYFRFLHRERTEFEVPAEHLYPRRLRGPAHGDLHGRNVLVGLEEDRAGTPALFDYENMSCDNLIGWDFVKLETELKIRALAAVLVDGGRADPVPTAALGRTQRYARAAEAFETRLAARTVACRESGHWPEGPDAGFGDERLDRLAALLLCVRQQAELHLGARRKRFRDWLHEYYFLLGCYGLTTVRFENQSEYERAAALVSAGVAAVQYEMGRPGAGPIGGAR